MNDFIIFDGIKIEYFHKISKGIKNSYIQVDKFGNVILKTNKTNFKRGKSILLEKVPWILKKIEQNKLKKLSVTDNEKEIIYLGKNYPVEIREKNSSDYIFDENIFTIFLAQKDFENKENIIANFMNHFYKKKSMFFIPQKVDYWSKIMNLKYTSISYRKMKRRWGSCSHNNELTFNSFITKLSEELIDYIIIHELCHIKEKNHSKDFWDLVKIYSNDYKEHHKKIQAVFIDF